MRILGVVCVFLFEILSIVEAVPFKVALLVLIFKGMLDLTKVVYDQIENVRILHAYFPPLICKSIMTMALILLLLQALM